jgi:molybdopterin converting factor small subunit
MELKVQYFAIFREQTGCGEESIDTTAGTPGALFEVLRERHPGLQRFEHMQVAINDKMGHWDTPLCEGDAVLLFPPVAGG